MHAVNDRPRAAAEYSQRGSTRRRSAPGRGMGAGAAALIALVGACGGTAAGDPLDILSGSDARAEAEGFAFNEHALANIENKTGGWRLAESDSPYLLQHVDNAVEWWPWGDAAFDEARARDVPIFLSVGYSTCHWCHVMEHESFEDPEIGAYLAEHFVSIKLDREQRPDVDEHYMQAVQAYTRGGGGWPMTVFLTADGKPFGGGTYYPPEPGFGRPGFRQLLETVVEGWSGDRTNLLVWAKRMDEQLKHDPLPAGGVKWDPEGVLAAATDELHDSMDPVWGGRRGAPKFPPSMAMQFLMRQHLRTGVDVLDRVNTTLDRMAAGGMRDQVGGGFHRYSVDAQWHVPHFEKMLYDNAQLAWVYAEGYALSGHVRHARVARDTLRWVLDDMRSPEGLFYSARDADSMPFDEDDQPIADEHPEEGLVYVWTPSQLIEALGPEDGAHFARLFDVTDKGNFEHGSSIPDPGRTHEAMALTPGEDLPTGPAFLSWLEHTRARLLVARARRPQAFRDEKCLAGWNGLMLSGLAHCANLLADVELDPPVPGTEAEAADLRRATRQAGQAMLDHFVRARLPSGRIPHQVFEGRPSGDGDLTDYALLGRGLLDAHAATGEPAFLAAALELARELVALFEDAEQGAFFTTTGDDPNLGTRGRELNDGAMPSGASVAVELLLRLAPLDDSRALRQAADRALGRYGPMVAERAAAWPAMLGAIDAAVGPLAEVVLDGSADDNADYRTMLATTRRTLLPAALVIPDASGTRAALAGGDADGEPMLLRDRMAPPGGARAWVCREGVCLIPANDADQLAEQLESITPR